MFSYDSLVLSGGFIQFVVFSFCAIIFIWKAVSWFLSLKERHNMNIRTIAKDEVEKSLIPIKEELIRLGSDITKSNDLTRKEIGITNKILEKLASSHQELTKAMINTNESVVRIEERVNNVKTDVDKFASR